MKRIILSALLFIGFIASASAQSSIVVKVGGGTGGTVNISYDSVQRNLSWYRPEEWGAKGDGTTNDGDAFRAMIAALPSNAVVYLSAKDYFVTGKITVNKRITFIGTGMQDNYNNTWGTRIKTNSLTDTLFYVTSTGVIFEKIAFRNTGTNPTAGSAIQIDIVQGVTEHPEWGNNVPGSYAIRQCSFDGFWNNVHQRNGMESFIDGCWFAGWRNYGLFLQNINLPDGGDLALSNTDFYPNRYTLSEASIYQTSGGGLKMSNCKFNGRPGFKTKWHYDASFQGSATSVMTVWNNSFENPKQGCIRIRGNNYFGLTTIGGNEYAMYEGTGTCIDIDNVPALEIGGGVFRATGSETALKLTNCPDAVVRALSLWGFTSSPVSISNCARIHVERNNQYQALTGLTPTFDVAKSKNATLTLTGTATVTMQNLVEGDKGRLLLTQDGTGGRTVYVTTGGTVLANTATGLTEDSIASGAGRRTAIDWEFAGGVLAMKKTRLTDAGTGGSANPGTAITFNPVLNIGETFTSSGIWQATLATTADNSYGQTGKGVQTLAANTTGRIMAQYGGTSGRSAVLYFATTSTLGGHLAANPSWGMVVDGPGNLYSLASGVGATVSGVSVTAPTWVSVYRDGTTGQMKIQTSPDAVNWTDRYTFAATSTAALNIYTDIFYYSQSQGRLVNPRIVTQ